jgi:hypothetical protein
MIRVSGWQHRLLPLALLICFFAPTMAGCGTSNSGNCVGQGVNVRVNCGQSNDDIAASSDAPRIVRPLRWAAAGLRSIGAGVLPPSQPNPGCGSINQDGFLSPAVTDFRDVAETYPPLSLDKRNAVLVRAFKDAQEYYMVESHFSGYVGGMQLRWSVDPSHLDSWHHCTVTIPAKSSYPLRDQVDSWAVPTVIDGEAVTFTGCLWHSNPSFQQECYSNVRSGSHG